MFRSKPLLAFVVILIIGGFLHTVAPALHISAGFYWIAVVLVAVVAALGVASGKVSSLPGLGSEFLCDSCKYNDARYCNRPERPNARRCPDYKR